MSTTVGELMLDWTSIHEPAPHRAASPYGGADRRPGGALLQTMLERPLQGLRFFLWLPGTGATTGINSGFCAGGQPHIPRHLRCQLRPDHVFLCACDSGIILCDLG